jgi:cobalt-zinc-cadmium efflux system membrane fusion protein
MNRVRIISAFLVPALLCVTACDKKEPAAQSKPTNTQTTAAAAETADWCAEHEIPESICTKCNKKLIADFKKKGDWCKEHDLPESHCTICNPDVKEKFLALKPKEGN